MKTAEVKQHYARKIENCAVYNSEYSVPYYFTSERKKTCSRECKNLIGILGPNELSDYSEKEQDLIKSAWSPCFEVIERSKINKRQMWNSKWLDLIDLVKFAPRCPHRSGFIYQAPCEISKEFFIDCIYRNFDSSDLKSIERTWERWKRLVTDDYPLGIRIKYEFEKRTSVVMCRRLITLTADAMIGIRYE